MNGCINFTRGFDGPSRDLREYVGSHPEQRDQLLEYWPPVQSCAPDLIHSVHGMSVVTEFASTVEHCRRGV